MRSELDKIPGRRVHIDQLECDRLVPQTEDHLHKDHYNCTTVLMDGRSNFGHIYLQHSTNAEQTLATKHDFECCAKILGARSGPMMETMEASLKMSFKRISRHKQAIAYCMRHWHPSQKLNCGVLHPNTVRASVIQPLACLHALAQSHLTQTVAIFPHILELTPEPLTKTRWSHSSQHLSWDQ
jgi:hypothetical protein